MPCEVPTLDSSDVAIPSTTDTVSPLPGDRYPLPAPIGQSPALAIAPYNFIFTAAAKGRWIGVPLLTLFAREFTYVAPLQLEDSNEPLASRDPRVTVMAYIEELRNGSLWLHGREAECRAAARAYVEEVTRYISANRSGSAECTWEELCRALLDGTQSEALQLLDAFPSRLVLRQRDTVHHRVLRRESPIPGGDILHILRYDHTAPTKEQQQEGEEEKKKETTSRLLVCRKPHGLPVHPSGRCRKNSVTSILMDVFGGPDAHRYHAVPLEGNSTREDVQCVAIRHKQYNFELIRVWVGNDYVRPASWQHLLTLLKTGPTSEVHEGLHENHNNRKSLSPFTGLKVFVVHRLDAPTSGVLLFGLDSASARMTAELLAQKSADRTEEEEEEDEEEESEKTAKKSKGKEDEKGAKVGCTKVYLARVKGCLEVLKLAHVQHHCSLTRMPNWEGFTSEWLRVNRPIGCLSHHDSLYWCPDAETTEVWMQQMAMEKSEEAKKQEATEKEVAKSCDGTDTKGFQHRSSVTLEAKHERMRQLTIGKRSRVPCVEKSTHLQATKADVNIGKRSRNCNTTDSNETEVLREDTGAVHADNRDNSVNEGSGIASDNDNNNNEMIERLKETLKRAVTCIRSIAYDAVKNESIVECYLLTGRTHQVRVHLASLGHPICGDVKYEQYAAKLLPGTSGDAEEAGPGILLHAWRYTLRFASNEAPEVFVAPPPDWARV